MGDELKENGCHCASDTCGKFTSTYMPGECTRDCPGHVNAIFVIFSGTFLDSSPGLGSVQQSTECATYSMIVTVSAARKYRRIRSTTHSVTPGSMKYHAMQACQ